MEQIALPKSVAMVGDSPNWYLEQKMHQFGDYFGSLGSLFLNETYVTHDLKHIVHRDKEGNVSVNRNVCAHAGAPLFDKPGEHPDKTIICPIHKWGYTPTGQCIAAKAIKDCKSISLQPEVFGIWNGYVLGYSQEHLNYGLSGFGAELGLGERCINPEDFVFVGKEEVLKLPYPREVMMINYFDGYHVPLFHQLTFDAIADCSTYQWELSQQRADCPVWYSTQVVRARKDVARHRDFLIKNHATEEGMGWVDLHLWLKKELPDAKTPIDPDIFAVWSSIYGNGYLMPELYEGGRFLAVSYLLNEDPTNPYEGNLNLIEFYVHKSIEERLRPEAASKFQFAYKQSAAEDDQICMKLWKSHRLGPMKFNRLYHETLEKGDPHWRTWCKSTF